MATKTKKNEIVAELEALFEKSSVAIVADLNGFSVAEITKFRRKLDKDAATCKVAKNTLITIASSKGAFAPLGELAKGPTALILGFEDPAAPTKTALAFLKEVKKGELKGGVLEGKLLTSAQLKAVADLPSREVILGGIAGALNSGAQGVAGILNNIIADIAVLVEKVAEKQHGPAPSAE
ncbi:MAG: 50S ribosomal protein L10 [Candidatus Obscuribacterales bacterium]|nr:50S ribosomal protein L10 [Candidatus Obscuribacterales bacterium]